MCGHTLEVAEVGLLVEVGFLEAERVDDVDLGLLRVVGIVAVTTLGGGVGTGVEGLTTDGDLGAVSLVGDTIDGLEVVRVGDELVAADNVLRKSGQLRVHSAPPLSCRRSLKTA